MELWTVPAEEFLEQGDVGVIPLVPLMHFDGQSESLFERCAAKIERKGQPEQRTDLLVVSELMAELRFPGTDLSCFFGGQETMIESPILQKGLADVRHVDKIDALKIRFGGVPRDMEPLPIIVNEKRLRTLPRIAITCPDLGAFRTALES